jgi:murein L,D-transpeptidase YcbB/YkuD
MMLPRLLFPLLAASALAGGLPVAASARPSSHPIEPVEIPPSIQQGVDLIYIDPEIAPELRQRDALLKELGMSDEPGAAVDLLLPASPVYTALRRGVMRYRGEFGALPAVEIPAGPAIKPGAKGERVALLRKRLGLAAGTTYDAALAKAVKRYQQVHGFKADGIAGAATIASLNRGAGHYERLLKLNMERARRLPAEGERERHILVDVGAARIHLYENGRQVDSMKAIVGKPASATPMMAALIKYASVNPYWNAPPDLAATLIAPKVIAEGVGYLERERYEVLSGWEEDARVVDPESVDWPAVAAGEVELRVRQLPGRGNSMGDIKFMMPNDYGIYLHDTPDKTLFAREDRWLSNGCVRVEDAHRLAKWLFGAMPKGSDPDAEEDKDLPAPVPVYITYLTAAASKDGVVFRADPYQRDEALLARHFPADVDGEGKPVALGL